MHVQEFFGTTDLCYIILVGLSELRPFCISIKSSELFTAPITSGCSAMMICPNSLTLISEVAEFITDVSFHLVLTFGRGSVDEQYEN